MRVDTANAGTVGGKMSPFEWMGEVGFCTKLTKYLLTLMLLLGTSPHGMRRHSMLISMRRPTAHTSKLL